MCASFWSTSRTLYARRARPVRALAQVARGLQQESGEAPEQAEEHLPEAFAALGP
jgi:hypothetical protein